MVAEHHADGRVQDFRRDAVAILIRQAGVRIPAAPMQVLEPDAEHRQILGVLARRRNQPHRDRLREPLDDEEVSPPWVALVKRIGSRASPRRAPFLTRRPRPVRK